MLCILGLGVTPAGTKHGIMGFPQVPQPKALLSSFVVGSNKMNSLALVELVPCFEYGNIGIGRIYLEHPIT